jgi:hypothetical protein
MEIHLGFLHRKALRVKAHADRTDSKTKGAVKLHTLLNLRGNIPEFVHISTGKLHDVNVLDILAVQPAASYVMDKAYVDFGRLCAMDLSQAFFVTRAKRRLLYRRRYSRKVEKGLGLRCDQTILQILSIALFEKKPIIQVFSEHKHTFLDDQVCNQLPLFDL